jgi:hypothetical protein
MKILIDPSLQERGPTSPIKLGLWGRSQEKTEKPYTGNSFCRNPSDGGKVQVGKKYILYPKAKV